MFSSNYSTTRREKQSALSKKLRISNKKTATAVFCRRI